MLHLGHRIGKRLAGMPPRAKVWVMIVGDALMLPICMFVAVALHLGSWRNAMDVSLLTQWLLATLTLPVLGAAGLYRTVLRYIDLRVIATASGALALAVVLVFLGMRFMRVEVLPRHALLMFWFVAFAYVVVSRLVARTLLHQSLRGGDHRHIPIAIYGAGAAGAQLAQAMKYSPEYKVACFIDDRRDLRNKSVVGLRVHGPDELESLVGRHDLGLVVVAMPSAGSADRQRVMQRLENSGLPVKMMPGLMDLVAGRASVTDIRDIDVADLLGRDPVPPEPSLFSRNISGKSVLVTGAGGSIGSELCRQILSQQPARLVMLDHSEFALYDIEQELRRMCGSCTLVPVLGSVLDEELLHRTLAIHEVQTAYHAAAYKHVPMVEANIRQGVQNNVFGTLALMHAARRSKLETCVLISTDKAVRPTNIMGASKRIAELVFQAAAARRDGPTNFSMVRFGNVLGSSGSVVPLFKKQIQLGGPVTITHPDIIRYFMLIPEAAQLVIQAGAMARGGEVFVLDMGEPVRIADLARKMIRLSGLTERAADSAEGDIELRFVGLRPGEKLYEELLIGDQTVPSGHPRIMCAVERFIEPVLLDKMLGVLLKACAQGDEEAVIRQVRNLVPEFRDADEVNAAADLGRGSPDYGARAN